jgi:small nuclear ribonucleoprotein (snRNP)-like protein
MGDFDDIRQMTMESIRTNRDNVNIMRNWKEEIRGTLMTVRDEFMNLIDDYTDKFVQSLRDVDQSSELAVYAGEDKR